MYVYAANAFITPVCSAEGQKRQEEGADSVCVCDVLKRGCDVNIRMICTRTRTLSDDCCYYTTIIFAFFATICCEINFHVFITRIFIKHIPK